MDNKKINFGFSLIELLVVIAITMVITAGGMMSYSQIQKQQTFKKEVKLLRSNLYQARQEALFGKKPVNNSECGGPFLGNKIDIVEDGGVFSFQKTGVCETGTGVLIDSYKLNKNVVIDPADPPVSFMFNSVKKGVTPITEVSFSVVMDDLEPEIITITTTGDIN